MTTTLTLLGVILVIGALAYRRASLFISTLVTFAALIIGGLYGHVPLLVWALFAVVAIPLNLVEFRRNQLTKPLFKLYKSIMPEMSRTRKKPSKRALPGGKPTCLPAIRTGRSCTPSRSAPCRQKSRPSWTARWKRCAAW